MKVLGICLELVVAAGDWREVDVLVGEDENCSRSRSVLAKLGRRCAVDEEAVWVVPLTRKLSGLWLVSCPFAFKSIILKYKSIILNTKSIIVNAELPQHHPARPLAQTAPPN